MRLFVAIELEDRARSVLMRAQAALRAPGDGVRWVGAEQLHLTLKFLGEVRDPDVPAVAEAVARAVAEVPRFDMEIADCGCFPPRGPARVVWAGVREESGVLAHCVERLERELEGLGFAREQRRFSAHITLGRVRRVQAGGRVRSAVEGYTMTPVKQPVASVTLMSSVLSPQGPTYTPVSRVGLG